MIEKLESMAGKLASQAENYAENLALEYPWQTDRTPYKVFIAEILLTKTSARKVSELFTELLDRYPTPCDLGEEEVGNLQELLYSLGLRKRTQMLSDAAKKVCYKYEGTIPNSREELLELEGVGPYTANAILCFGFGKRVPIVDAGVVRLFGRYFGHLLPATSYRDP